MSKKNESKNEVKIVYSLIYYDFESKFNSKNE